MTAQIEFLPAGQYTIKDLDTLLVALETRVKAREVMHTKDAAAYLGISPRQVQQLAAVII